MRVYVTVNKCLMRHCSGFVEEGRHRKIVWIDGGWRDTIFMGILEDEWAVLKQSAQSSV